MSSRKEKQISVVIPVFNREKYISDAIQSVINQSLRPKQIVVIDDGSTDNTEKEIRKFGDSVTYICQKNGGVSKARNAGISAVETEYISFLDSDDVWHPKKLEKQVFEFEKHKNLKITLGLCVVSDFANGSDIVMDGEKEERTFKLLFGSALIKRSVFNEVGLLEESLKVGEDTDWFIRAREKKIPFSVHKDVVLFVRKHQSNITNTHRVGTSSVLKVLKIAKDRKKVTDARDISKSAKPKNIDELIEMWNTI